MSTKNRPTPSERAAPRITPAQVFLNVPYSKFPPRALLPDLRQMILTAREQVARAIDGRLALLY